MAITKIEFDVSLLLTKEYEEIIIDCLEISEVDLQSKLNNIAMVAFAEFVKMFTENGVPTRSTEVLEQKLLLLLIHYYKDNLPTENEISKIFQITSSSAKTLLKNTMSKHRITLANHLKVSIKKSLSGSNYRTTSGIHYFKITSDYIVNAINEHIKNKRPDLDRLVNNTGSSGEYKCGTDTYNYLYKEYIL